MNQTQAYYYWAIINHKDWVKQGNQFIITEKQLMDFDELLKELLLSKSPEEALKKLPPQNTTEINYEYWNDIEKTKTLVEQQINLIDNETDTGTLIYYGDLPDAR